jgi:hypothetical protein
MTKYLRKSAYEEERFISTHGFQRFQSTVAWPCCLGPVVAQYNIAGAHGRGALLPYALPGHTPSDLTSFY